MAPFPVQLNEVCKVRNAAVARAGSKNGYSLAIVKKTNKASVHISLLDAKYACTDTFTVKLDTLWKLKASQRKALERKVLKANTPASVNETTVVLPVDLSPPMPPPLYVGVEEVDRMMFGMARYFVHNLKCVAKLTLGGSDTTLHLAHNSVVKFTGDAIVNAANEGCLGGGGIDGVVNDLGGFELEDARRQLPLLADSPYIVIVIVGGRKWDLQRGLQAFTPAMHLPSGGLEPPTTLRNLANASPTLGLHLNVRMLYQHPKDCYFYRAALPSRIDD